MILAFRRLKHDDPLPLNCKDINMLLSQQSPGTQKRELTEEELREILNNPLFYLYVAYVAGEHRDRYVGMATMFFQRNLARWIAEIHDVVVHEAYRGKGLGKDLTRLLMATAQSFCQERNIKLKLFLTSRPSRVVANAMYQKLGFVLVSQSHGPWGTNLYKIIVEPDGFRGLP